MTTHQGDRYRRIGTSPHVNAPDAVFHTCRGCGCAVIDKAVHDGVCPGREATGREEAIFRAFKRDEHEYDAHQDRIAEDQERGDDDA